MVVEMALPPGDDAPGVVEPREDAFDFPAEARRRAAVLGACADQTIGRDHLDAVRAQSACRGADRCHSRDHRQS
jgi:hypothetical protein